MKKHKKVTKKKLKKQPKLSKQQSGPIQVNTQQKIQVIKTVGYYAITDKVLGKGNRSIVHLGLHELSRRKVAVKFFTKEYVEACAGSIETEVELLKKFKNDREVITLENSFLDNMGNYYMVFELANGNLQSLMKENGMNLTEKEIMRIFVQILKGVYVLHENNVVHGDIKLENIFVFNNKTKDSDDDVMNISLKIGDLGFSCYQDDKTLLNNFSGSPLYAAPEITLSLPYNGRKSDIWSLGVVVYYLMYLKFPFDVNKDKDISLLYSKIQTESVDLDDAIREVSDDCKHLISLLLSKNPMERPDVNQIINHPWIVNNLLVL